MKSLLLCLPLAALSSFAHAESETRYEFERPLPPNRCVDKINAAAERFGYEATVDHTDPPRFQLELLIRDNDGKLMGTGVLHQGVCHIEIK